MHERDASYIIMSDNTRFRFTIAIKTFRDEDLPQRHNGRTPSDESEMPGETSTPATCTTLLASVKT